MLEAGIDAVVANPGFLLGPGDPYRVSTWPVYRYLEGKLRITTRGGLSFCDARDVAAGLILLADRGRSRERYILTHAEGSAGMFGMVNATRSPGATPRRCGALRAAPSQSATRRKQSR